MTNNRQEQFKNKLFALLREYDVEMQVEEKTMHWECYADGISFYSCGRYDADGDCLVDGIDFKLGNYTNGKMST
jgi:hypothetical protein